jgi:hypothetical protein
MIVVILVAAENFGVIPNDPLFLKKLGSFRKTPNLKPLIEADFLIEMLAPASKVLDREEGYREETYREEIEKKEIASPTAQPVFHMEQKGKPRKGTRLEEGWLPSSEDHLYAVGLLGEAGVARQLDDFRDYWMAKSGQGALKIDWGRTWRTWCRKAKDWNGNGYSRDKSLKERTADALHKLGSGSFSETLDLGLPKLSHN